MPELDLRGQRIHYEDSGGAGPAVVFSHGFLCDGSVWAAVIAALEGRFRCIAWDQRGHGRTVEDGKPFTFWDSAGDLIALLDALELDRAALVGHSQGGRVSLRAALTAPERVAALVLVGAQARALSERGNRFYRGVRRDWAELGPAAVAGDMGRHLFNDPAAAEPWLEKWRAEPRERHHHRATALIEAEDVTPRLPELGMPSLLIVGEADDGVSLESAEEACRELGDCRGVVRIGGASHTPIVSEPESVIAPLEQFLGEALGAQGAAR